jgi:hypothetical protein
VQGLIYEFSWFINLKIDDPWTLKGLSEELYVIYFLMFYLYWLRNKWNSWMVGSYFVLTIYNLSIKNCFLLKITYSGRVLAAPEIVYENEESIPAREKERGETERG